MIELLGYTRESLYQEVLSRGKDEGIFSEEGFRELVEEVIEEHREWGEIHDDDPTEGLELWVGECWPRYQEDTGITAEEDEISVS